MKTYKVEFIGKTDGAIGCECKIICLVKGENEVDANINLYDNFDNIRILEMVELQTPTEISDAEEFIKGDFLITEYSHVLKPFEIGYYRK